MLVQRVLSVRRSWVAGRLLNDCAPISIKSKMHSLQHIYVKSCEHVTHGHEQIILFHTSKFCTICFFAHKSNNREISRKLRASSWHGLMTKNQHFTYNYSENVSCFIYSYDSYKWQQTIIQWLKTQVYWDYSIFSATRLIYSCAVVQPRILLDFVACWNQKKGQRR